MVRRARKVSESSVQAQQFSLFTDDTRPIQLLCVMSPEQLRAVQHPAGLLAVLYSLCRHAVQSLPAVHGAGVLMRFRGRSSPVAWTAPWVRVLDDHQCADRDGPGLRAMHTQRGVASGRQDMRARWPALADAVDDARIRSVHAAPFPVNIHAGGVLTLYSTTRAVIDPPPERLTVIKNLLTAALTAYCAAHPHEDHTIRLHRELHNRQLLGQAIDVLIGRHQVSADRARQMLTEQATDRKTTTSTAARAVIRQHLQ
jgi:hypothetical protein